jgi:hypothetical protein
VYTKPTVSSEYLRQGELVTGLIQGIQTLESIPTEVPVIQPKTHAMAIVMSQECDIERGFEKLAEAHTNMPSVLFCECFLATEIRASIKNNDEELWRFVRQNGHMRYHLLPAVPPDADTQGAGFPELCLDFRRCFTLPTPETELKVRTLAKRRTRIETPHREQVIQRFFHYQARVPSP